jgi:hypothetical protein
VGTFGRWRQLRHTHAHQACGADYRAQDEDFTLKEAMLLSKLRLQEERKDDDSRAPGSTDTTDGATDGVNLYAARLSPLPRRCILAGQLISGVHAAN